MYHNKRERERERKRGRERGGRSPAGDNCPLLLILTPGTSWTLEKGRGDVLGCLKDIPQSRREGLFEEGGREEGG